MKNVIWPLAVVLMLVLGSGAIAQDSSKESILEGSVDVARGLVKIEFRLATSGRSLPGLTTYQEVGNTDKKVHVYYELDKSGTRHKMPLLSNDLVATADVEIDTFGKPSIKIAFTEVGAKKMADFTAQHIGKKLAIIIDGKVISTPTIRDVISSKAVITGDFTEKEARRIALGIRPRDDSSEVNQRAASKIVFQAASYSLESMAYLGSPPIKTSFGGKTVYLDPTAILTDKQVAHTSVKVDKTGSPRIMVEFAPGAIKRTDGSIPGKRARRLAVIIDGDIICLPQFSWPSSHVYITGEFSKEEAQQIADRIMLSRELTDSLFGLRAMVRLNFGIAVPKPAVAEGDEVISAPQPAGSVQDVSESVRTAAFVYRIGEPDYKHPKLPWLPSEFIANARVIPDRADTPSIEVEFTKTGVKRMAELASKHAGKGGIFDDTGEFTWTTKLSNVVSSRAIITGNFSNDEALQIAARIAGRDESKVAKVSAGSPIEFRVAYPPEPLSPRRARVVEISFKNKPLYLDTTAKLTSEIVSHLQILTDEATNKPTILVSFTKDGAAKMAGLTKYYLGKKLAILVDGKVMSAPTMQSPISSEAVITGNFSMDEAKRIVDVIVPPNPILKDKEPEKTGSIVIDIKKADVGALVERLNQQYGGQFTIKADEKNKRILFHAPFSTPTSRVIEVIELIEQLDVEGDSSEILNATEEKAQQIAEEIVGKVRDTRRLYAVKLERADANSLAPILNLMFSDEITIYAHSQSALGVRVPESLSKAVGDLIQQFDHSKADIEKIIDTESLSLYVQSKQRTDALRDSVLSPGKIQQLQLKQVRTKKSLKGMSSDWQDYTKKHSLRVADMVMKSRVTELFETRQQINESDLAALELELSNARKTLDEREKNKQQIIDRRIEELTNSKPKSQ